MSTPYKVGFTGYDDSTTNSSETMPRQGQEMQVADWHGPEFQNMRRRYGKTIQRLGQTPISSTTYPDLQMLYWCKIDSTEHLLAVSSGSIYDAYTGRVITGGASRFTPGNECNAAWINDMVVIGDGLDPNVRFDGSTVTRLTVQPCDASNMTLTALGSLGSSAPTGTYQYAVKFVNADGIEGDITGLGTATTGLSPLITVLGQQIRLTNIPVCPAGQDCSARNIYRCNNLDVAPVSVGGKLLFQASAFFFVATVTGNVTTTFTDNLYDVQFTPSGTISSGPTELGLQMANYGSFIDPLNPNNPPLLYTPNTPFPPCRYFTTHLGRLLGGYCLTADSDTRTFHYSDDLDPTTARTATNPSLSFMGGRIKLADRSGGDITALSESYGSQVLVFTGGEASVWSGTDNTNYDLLPFAPHGCVSSKSIAHFEAMMLWMAPDGLYTFTGTSQAVFTGTSFRRISEDIRVTIDGMSAADMAAASAVVSDHRYYLTWPNGSLVLDLLYDGSWYRDEPERFTHLTDSVFTSDNRARIYAYHPSDRTIWQLETGITDNGKAIPCRVRTPDLNLGGIQQNARVIHYGGLFRACSDAVSGILWRGTAQPVYTTVVSMTSGSEPGPSFDPSIYPLDTVRMRQRTPTDIDPVSTEFALSFGCDSLSGKFEILEGSFEWEPAGAWAGS